MATNITVVDSVNYPDNTKTIAIDLKLIVDALSEGDERWFITVTTNALGAGSSSIDDELVSYTLNGFSKSSGLVSGPFVVASGTNYLRVSIDGSTSREITITPGTYTGTSLADEIQEKIIELSESGGLEAGNLSFKNSVCDFNNNKFELKSGTISNTYTGSGKSSVVVLDGVTDTGFAAQTGFDIPYESESLSAISDSVVTTKLSGAVASGTALSVADGSGFSDGDAILIKDADGSQQKFIISSGGGTNSFVVTPAVNVSLAINARVQTLVEMDPDSIPTSPTSDVDSILKKAIASIVAQIDFSL